MLCLPESCLSGYGCEDLYFADYVEVRARQSLRELIPQTRGIAVAVGMPLRVEGTLYNAEAVIADGKLLGFAAKPGREGSHR